MATVEQAQTSIAVENPATGEIIREVPVTDDVAAMVARARVAQSAWEALGFEGRGRILRRARQWLIDHADEVVATIVAETGKAEEDARLGGRAYGADAFGVWGGGGPQELRDGKGHPNHPLVLGRQPA